MSSTGEEDLLVHERGHESYLVRGGRPVGGTYTPKGNKNAALPMLAAALLTDEPVRLENIPEIRDVGAMLTLLEDLGADISRPTPGTWEVTCARSPHHAVHQQLARDIRASFLLAGPLLARVGRCLLPRPGGDRIGRRPLDTHIHALQALGAEVEVAPDHFLLTAPHGLRGTDLFLREMSVMGTENALMAAALADGVTTIRNAASEPHVQDLCHLLGTMGCPVEGVGTNSLRLEGRRRLGGATARSGPDHVEVGSFIALAAVTGGELTVRGGGLREHLPMTELAYSRLGVRWEWRGDDLVVPGGQQLVIQDDIHGAIPKIDDGPWPAFPADLTSIAVVLATQARGTVLIHEKMFESRLFWLDRLIAMGANIVLCDPHRAVVVGPSPLYGKTLSSPDIRAGMALVIAALCAEGESVIHNVHQVERGYEALDERLRALGADIEAR